MGRWKTNKTNNIRECDKCNKRYVFDKDWKTRGWVQIASFNGKPILACPSCVGEAKDAAEYGYDKVECVSCGEVLDKDSYGCIYDCVHLRTSGNYGSKLVDYFDEGYIDLYLCDTCLLKRSHVIRYTPSLPKDSSPMLLFDEWKEHWKDHETV